MIYSIFSSSIYTIKFINLFYKNRKRFKIDDHLFIIHTINNNNNKRKILNQLGSYCKIENINFVPNNYDIFRLIKNVSKDDRIIIHQLNKPKLMLYLYFWRHIIDRCTWSIWGGDVYFFRNNPGGIKKNLIEYLRRKFIPLIPRITSIIKGDYDVVQRIYGGNASYLYSFYPIPTNFDLVNKILSEAEDRTDRIVMLGNSADPASNHIEMLNCMEKYKDQNIKILCPLSYGKREYAEDVIRNGRARFGEKFIALTEFINPERYMQILGAIDVMILNHKWQKGLGSIISALALEKKIYIRSDTTPFSFFKEKKVELYDTLKLKNDDYQTLFTFDKDIGKANSDIIRKEFSEEHSIKLWRKVLEK